MSKANEQDIKKSIEKVVDEILKPTEEAKPTEETKVEKAMPSSSPANGGEDKIRSGSPNCEEQSAMDKKKEEAKKAESEDDEDEKKKKEKMKKAEDEKDEDEKDEKKDMKKKMKKSIEELSAHLDEEELELVKAWREETSKEEVITKAEPVTEKKEEPKEDFAKSLTKVLEEQLAPLKKAIEDKDAALKGLTEKVEKMASQPAYDRRSISNLETLEKSGASETREISKAQVLEKMLELQLAGKGVTSHHIGEFEATKNISDPRVKELVFKELNVK